MTKNISNNAFFIVLNFINGIYNANLPTLFRDKQ